MLNGWLILSACKVMLHVVWGGVYLGWRKTLRVRWVAATCWMKRRLKDVCRADFVLGGRDVPVLVGRDYVLGRRRLRLDGYVRVRVGC